MPAARRGLEHQLEENLVTVSLDDIHELFVDQPFNIFSEDEWDYMGESVLDRITMHMTPGMISRKRPFRLVIRLPEEKIVPGIARQTESAVRRWARQKTMDNQLQIRVGRWNSLRSLVPGFLFLGGCLVLGSFILESMGPYVGAVLAFILAESVLIIGVVSLETPVSSILYDHLPYRRENSVLEILARMEIEILPQSPAGDR